MTSVVKFASLEGGELHFSHRIPFERKKKKNPSVISSYDFIVEIELLSPGSMSLSSLSSPPKGCPDGGIAKTQKKNFT